MSHSGPWNCNLFNHEFLNFSYRKPIESSHCKSKQIILKNHSWTAVINKYLTKQLSKNFSLRIIFTDLWCMIIKKWLPTMMDDTCSCTNHTWLVRALIIHTWFFCALIIPVDFTASWLRWGAGDGRVPVYRGLRVPVLWGDRGLHLQLTVQVREKIQLTSKRSSVRVMFTAPSPGESTNFEKGELCLQLIG